MFEGINIYIFKTKPCSQGLIFEVSFAICKFSRHIWWYLFLRFKDGHEIHLINPSQTDEFTVSHQLSNVIGTQAFAMVHCAL